MMIMIIYSTYAQFKQCVNRPLLEECGRKAKNLMDHSMSFLISRCQHYTDNFNRYFFPAKLI